MAGAGDAHRRRAADPRLPDDAGVFLVLSISVVLANFVADMIYGVLDPRVRT